PNQRSAEIQDLDSMTDEELLRRTASKDVEAFKILVHRLQGRVLGLCSRLLSHPQNAEDVAQDVFFQLFKSARTFRGDCSVSTWLYRIAVNRCRNFNRDNKKFGSWGELGRELKTEYESGPDFPAPGGDNPASAGPVNEARELVRRAVASLPEKQKAVLVLHKFDGRSYQEIAEIMGVSLASVASCLHRAKRNLQKELSPLFPEVGRGRKF
ncbi:MAG: sigma-70 family RNA polymerase sigma factor, partial [Acidobacteriota bacterium]|nr:sigma-70 family RNA polymerase sigma factor [Acidobacteriota bacterium]